MENKLEQLLNSLIEKGWRPFNKDIREFFTLNEFTCGYRGEGTNHLGTIRAIVSKESGLWQFVCENGLTALQVENNNTQSPQWRVRYHWNKHSNGMQEDEKLSKERKRNENYEYRLIESALKDESELEDFLLQNIKVGNED